VVTRPSRQRHDRRRLGTEDHVWPGIEPDIDSIEMGTEWHYIVPGKPMQNGYIESFNGESFNGRMRDELLKESLFLGLADARAAIAAWAADYKTARQAFLAGLPTPAAFAAHLTATRPCAALADGSALRPVAQPAPKGVSTAVAPTATA